MDCSSIVNLSQSLDVSQYYIYEGMFGRISSEYIKLVDGSIKEVADPGTITILYN